VTEESWFGEDPVAKQVVYLTGTTVTASTPSNIVEQWSWNFPVGMDKVVGQIKTFFSYAGVPRVWTMYQSTSGTYTLVRNLWAQPNTQEFSYNLPGSFTVNGERPIGIWLTPFSNVLFYTNYHNVYEFNTTTSALSFLQAAPNPFQSFQPGWSPIWLGQPWTCDIPPASPTPTNTPTQTQTPTFTPTNTPTQTITPTTTQTPTFTPTSTEVPVTPTPTSTEVSVTPTPTSTEVPVTPTPTSTEVSVTPTSTPTVTPTVTSSENTTPTPTSTEVPVTPSPTPTCGYGGCFHYAAVTLSGATTILFDLCGTPLGNTDTLTASTYPSTVLVGPFFEDDCLSGDSYTVLSGSTPIAVEYFNPCCEPVSSCDGCYEYNIDGGTGTGDGITLTDQQNITISEVLIQNPGYNYQPEDIVTDNFENEYNVVIDNGSISSITPINITDITDLPIIRVISKTGSGAKLKPVFGFRTLFQGEVKQVIDCVV
jgi:hypothetical protein